MGRGGHGQRLCRVFHDVAACVNCWKHDCALKSVRHQPQSRVVPRILNSSLEKSENDFSGFFYFVSGEE